MSRMRQGCPLSPLLSLIPYNTGIPKQSNKARERNNRDSNRKEEVKLLLFTDYRILYLKDPKESIKKLLDLISTFGNVSGYKGNKQKAVVLLYIRLRKKSQKKTHP
jgi:hypothetical protein